jgi:Mg2+ and Co2+ transporter CorA
MGMALAGAALDVAGSYASSHEAKRAGAAMEMGAKALEFGGIGMMIGGPLGAAAGAAIGLAYAATIGGGIDKAIRGNAPDAEQLADQANKAAELALMAKESKGQAPEVKKELQATLKNEFDSLNAQMLGQVKALDTEQAVVQNIGEQMEDRIQALRNSDLSADAITAVGESVNATLDAAVSASSVTKDRRKEIKDILDEQNGAFITASGLAEKKLSDEEIAIYRLMERKKEIDKLAEERAKKIESAGGQESFDRISAEKARTAQLEAEGKAMIEETQKQLGATTIDNVEARMQKIKEVGVKLHGNIGEFNKKTQELRDDLAGMDFTIMTPKTQEEFAKGVASVSHVGTFLTGVQNSLTTLSELAGTLSSLGSAKNQSSTVGRFLAGIDSFKGAVTEITSKLTTGFIADDVPGKIDAAGKNLAPTVASLRHISDGVNTVQTILKDVGATSESIKNPEIFKNLATPSDVSDQLKKGKVKDSLDSIRGIADSAAATITSLEKLSGGGGVSMDMSSRMNESLTGLATMLEGMTGSGAAFESLVKSSEKIAKEIGMEKVKRISSAKDVISEFFNSTSMISEAMKKSVGTGTDAGISDVASSIQGHMERMQQANNEFQSGLDEISASAPTEINLKLGQVANSIGLKDATYPLQRGGLNMVFKFTIQVDGKSLETAMVSKENSAIVQAFKAAGHAPSGFDTNVPLNVTPRVAPSDIRLKEQIKFVGKSKLGINIYNFKYAGKEGYYQGVMAQDLIGTPYASALHFDGQYYNVDYSKLDVEFIRIN